MCLAYEHVRGVNARHGRMITTDVQNVCPFKQSMTVGEGGGSILQNSSLAYMKHRRRRACDAMFRAVEFNFL